MVTAVEPTLVEGADFYVPAYEVMVEGKRLDVSGDVISLEYRDTVTALDSVSIALNAWDGIARSSKYLDETFAPGSELGVKFGYRGAEPPTKMLTGEITEWSTTFPSSGTPVVTVSATNILNRFRKKKRSHAFFDRNDRQIAEEIGKKLNVDIKFHENRGKLDVQEYVLQDDQFDIVFLYRRAHERGYEIRVGEPTRSGRDATLHYSPSTARPRPTYELEYGASLVEFVPKLNTHDQIAEVVVTGWHPTSKRALKGDAKRSDADIEPIPVPWLQAAVDRAVQGNDRHYSMKGILNSSHAERVAKEILNRNVKQLITATGKTVGLPGLRAGNTLEVTGVELFSGRYYVTGTTHSIGSGGYTTGFTCRWEGAVDGGRSSRV